MDDSPYYGIDIRPDDDIGYIQEELESGWEGLWDRLRLLGPPFSQVRHLRVLFMWVAGRDDSGPLSRYLANLEAKIESRVNETIRGKPPRKELENYGERPPSLNEMLVRQNTRELRDKALAEVTFNLFPYMDSLQPEVESLCRKSFIKVAGLPNYWLVGAILIEAYIRIATVGGLNRGYNSLDKGLGPPWRTKDPPTGQRSPAVHVESFFAENSSDWPAQLEVLKDTLARKAAAMRRPPGPASTAPSPVTTVPLLYRSVAGESVEAIRRSLPPSQRWAGRKAMSEELRRLRAIVFGPDEVLDRLGTDLTSNAPQNPP